MADFIPGLQLNESFFNEIVAPLLRSNFPELRYSAALIGWGSEVLGFDDAQSTDHNWGLRFQLFLSEQDYERYRHPINQALNEQLPTTFRGHPINFTLSVNEDQRASGEIKSAHNIDIDTIKGLFIRYLGCDPYSVIGTSDWLTLSEHKLLALTRGKVFHDGLDELESIRLKFNYYPRDIWLYMLATQWTRIFEEQAFVGRCGYAGDELGSMLIAARQIKNLMKLCFLMERKYSPYGKWFGTAFSRLDCAQELNPIFNEVLASKNWQERQKSLARAYEVVAQMHNALQITIPLEEKAAQYFNRPYLVVGDARYAEEIRKALGSEEVKSIQHELGSVNQFIDSTEQLDNAFIRQKLKELYK